MLTVQYLVWTAGGISVEMQLYDVFTGIVERTGELVGRNVTDDGIRLRIAAEELDDLHHGQSIALSGTCLTVEEFGHEPPSSEDLERIPLRDNEASPVGNRDWFETFLAAETVEKTYLGELDAGAEINIERAMPADGRFDGHVVQGHVDAVAEVVKVEQVGEDWRFGFALPAEFGRYVVEKGSITLDGISLTVADREQDTVEVAIIPTTYQMTTLSEKSEGDPIHLEVDVMAKYAENMIEGY